MGSAFYSEKLKFGGKTYSFLYYRYSKREAKKDAERERRKGWSIRIIKRDIGGHIYFDLYGRR